MNLSFLGFMRLLSQPLFVDWRELTKIDSLMVGRLPLLPVKALFFNQLLDFFFVAVEGEVEPVGRVELDGEEIRADPSSKATFKN